MSANYKFVNTGLLAGLCALEGVDQFVRVEGKAWLDIDALYRHDEKLFHAISTDIERGYRTRDDYVIKRVETAFLRHEKAKWQMSYIGKAEMQIYIPDNTKAREAQQSARGLIELMQSNVEMSFDGYHICFKAPVTTQKREDARGRTRSIPVIDHQFQQLRPLLVPMLDEQKELRLEARRTWAARPVIPLDWRR